MSPMARLRAARLSFTPSMGLQRGAGQGEDSGEQTSEESGPQSRGSKMEKLSNADGSRRAVGRGRAIAMVKTRRRKGEVKSDSLGLIAGEHTM